MLEVEGLLTLTDPGLILGPMVILRFADGESDDLGVGEAGRDGPESLEGARLGADIVGLRLEIVVEGDRLGLIADGARLGALTVGDRLGGAGLKALLPGDGPELIPPPERAFSPGALLEALRVEPRELLDEAMGAGVGVAVPDDTPEFCL